MQLNLYKFFNDCFLTPVPEINGQVVGLAIEMKVR